MGELQVRLVAADREVWSGTATMVVAKTTEGEIGILPSHEPVLALLVDGVVRIEEVGGTRVVAAVHGGYFSVDSDQVAILAETAELASEIDVERAKRAIERATPEAPDDTAQSAALIRGETRVRAAMTHRQTSRR